MPSFPPSFTAFFPSSSPLPLLFITFLYYRCRRHLNKHHTTIFYQPSLTTILSPQPPYIPQTCYPVIVNTTSAMLTVSLFAPLPHLPFFHLFFLFPYFLPPNLLSPLWNLSSPPLQSPPCSLSVFLHFCVCWFVCDSHSVLSSDGLQSKYWQLGRVVGDYYEL